MKLYARLAFIVMFVAGLGRAASADDASDLQAKVSAALAAQNSYVSTLTAVSAVLTARTTVVAPDRSHTSVATSGQPRDIVTIGDTVYTSSGGGPYEKHPAGTAAGGMRGLTAISVLAIMPDTTVNGVMFGVFQTSLGTITFTCTYDKKSYLPSTCTSDVLVQVFSNYNDPKNVVEIPKDVK